jgi:CheY-like chemotaxis protein
MSGRTIHLLLVENDPREESTFLETLQSGRLANPVVCVEDARHALEYFRTTTHLPDLVLLDLNWPKMDGYELMSEMRHCPRLAGVPLIVMTSSDADKRLVEELSIPATSSLPKPLSADGLIRAILALGGFGIAIIPHDRS